MNDRRNRRRATFALESLEGRKAPSAGIHGALHAAAHVRRADDGAKHKAKPAPAARHRGLDERAGHDAVDDNAARHSGVDEKAGHDAGDDHRRNRGGHG